MTHTVIVNEHGALILLAASVEVDQIIRLENPNPGEELLCRVTSLGPSFMGKGSSDLKNARLLSPNLPASRSGTRSISTVLKTTDPCCSSFGCQNTFFIVGLGACENRGKIAPAKTANALIFLECLKDYSLTVLVFPKKALFGHTQKSLLQGAPLVVSSQASRGQKTTGPTGCC
jgi:hypothetical protein